jgi:hypothetical protein
MDSFSTLFLSIITSSASSAVDAAPVQSFVPVSAAVEATNGDDLDFADFEKKASTASVYCTIA